MAYNPDLKVSATNPIPTSDGSTYNPDLEVSESNPLPVAMIERYNIDFTQGGAGVLSTVDSENWAALTGTINQTAGGDYTSGADGENLCAFVPLGSVADQWASFVLAAMNAPEATGYYIGVGVRLQDDGGGYLLQMDRVSWFLSKYVSGVFIASLADASYTPTVGEVWKIKAIGSTITAYINDIPLVSVTDSTFSTGKTGIWAGDIFATVRGTDFSAEWIPTYISNVEVSGTNLLPIAASGYNPDVEVSEDNPLAVAEGGTYDRGVEVSDSNPLAVSGL